VSHGSLQHTDIAIKDLTEAIKLDGEQSRFFYWRGIYDRILGKYNDATQDQSRAIELDNSNPDYFMERGLCFRALKLLSQSTQDFTFLIELEPNLTQGYILRSVNWSLAKDYGAAIADLKKALAIDSEDVEVKLLKGLVLVESGSVPQGIKDLTELGNENPDDPYPIYSLYWAYKKTNQHELASKALDRFKKLEGDEKAMKEYLSELGCDPKQP